MYHPYDGSYCDEANEFIKSRSDQWVKSRETDVEPHDFQLYNFLSSRMNKRQYQTAVRNLWDLTAAVDYYHGRRHPSCLGLGSTPLNEAVLCAMQQVPEFQRKNDIQIVNTVFLTDGEGHGLGMGPSYYEKNRAFVRDEKTRRTYEIKSRGFGSNETQALLEMLRDQTGSNLVGIRLHDAKNIKHLRWSGGWETDEEFETASKQYANQNFTTMDSAYNEYFIVKGDLKVEFDPLQNLDDDASFTRIKNAFVKGGSRKKSSRVIANRMVEIFAA